MSLNMMIYFSHQKIVLNILLESLIDDGRTLISDSNLLSKREV